MHFLLFAPLLFAAPGQDAVVHPFEVYAAEPSPQTVVADLPELRGAIPQPPRRSAARAARVGTAHAPIVPRRSYTAVRAQFFTGSYDTLKQFDYPWHGTPSPSLPETILVAPSAIESIPAPPPQ